MLFTASTNKAEAYNGFSKWLFFGGEGVIAREDVAALSPYLTHHVEALWRLCDGLREDA